MRPTVPRRTRRTILRGAGVVLTLPFLESLVPRAAAAKPAGDSGAARIAERRGRLVCVYKAHGVCNESWYPGEFGLEFPVTPSLAPLEPLRRRVTFLSGLSHGRNPEGGGHAGVDVWLTGSDPQRPRIQSLDQRVAAALRGQTRFDSLQLGTKSGTRSAMASFTLSYDEQGLGLPSENDLRRVFQRLFVDESRASRAAHEQRLLHRRSILDAVLEQSKSVAGQLNDNDRRKLDEYFQSVREVERRVAESQNWLDRPKPVVESASLALDVAIARNKSEFLRSMYDLASLALVTDATRVVTFVTSPEGANSEAWPELGLGGTHHSLQHHNGQPKALAKLAEIDRAEVALWSQFLAKLAAANDGDGNLLDRTVVLYGSGMNNGSNDFKNGRGTHGTRKLPLLVAGGEALGLRQGRHLHFDGDKTPLCSLHVSLLQAIGLEVDAFGDAKSRLDGLRAS